MTFLTVSAAGVVTQAKGVQEKRDVLSSLGDDDLVLVAWKGGRARCLLGRTGQRSTDIFLVDDLAAAKEVLA